ncbi:MAG: MarR family winged helix-turn-helix transcriptional regulator [Mesorhizobium sp.]|nr:MarR family winged helix-turn-helix transcriptional regulator [Mesorhizobium sp.]
MADFQLHQRLGYKVSRLSRIMQSRLERLIAEQGLTRLMWCVLTGIGDEGVSTPSELADYIGITRPATSRLLREMEAKGMVLRHGSDADGRGKTVSLTPFGQKLLEAARPSMEAVNQHFTSKIEPEELARIMSALERLAEGEDEEITRL